MQEVEERVLMSKLDQSKHRRTISKKGHKTRVTVISREKSSVKEERNKLQRNTVKSKNQIKCEWEEIWS